MMVVVEIVVVVEDIPEKVEEGNFLSHGVLKLTEQFS